MEPEESYLSLLAQLRPAPIESEEHYDRVAAQLEALTDAQEAAETPDEGRERMIELLVTLLGVWDDANHPDPEVTPAEMLSFMLESRGLKKAELARAIGIERQELTGLDTGERDFPLRIARLVSDHFGQSIELYLRKYPKPDAA